MVLVNELAASPNVCSFMTTIFTDMADVIGGGDRALALIYIFVFIIPITIALGVGKDTFWGLMGAFFGNTVLLLLMNTSCLTITTDYLAFGYVFEAVLIGLFAIIYLKRS